MNRSRLRRLTLWLSKNGADVLMATCVFGTCWAVVNATTGPLEAQGNYLAVAVVFAGLGMLLYLGEPPRDVD